VAGAGPTNERYVLGRSIAVTALLGSLGVVWGIVTGSQMILLDGVYAVIGIVISFLLMRASSLAAEGPTSRYPYGREGVTPLVIGIQGFVLLATLVYAAIEAVYTIRLGGSEIEAGQALAYGVVTTTASIVFWRWIHARSVDSDVLTAESIGWRVAALRGVGMSLGFALLVILTDSSWQRAAPYVDPVMVLITCVAFVPAPLRMVRSTVMELLEGAPPRSVQEPVLAVVSEVFREFDIDEPVVRMTKVGPKLYLEVDGSARPDATIADEHRVRMELLRRLEQLPLELWLNFELLPQLCTEDLPST
jgi:predicted Co/Zn/Cd cation transporter (cation efflux family)